MLIYNTTYQTGIDDARNFVIWLSESYIPEVEKTGILQNPRLTHILSHKEQDSECFSLQWEVEDTAALHRWHTQQGMHLNEEMMKIFKEKVGVFPTLSDSAGKRENHSGYRSWNNHNGVWPAESSRY